MSVSDRIESKLHVTIDEVTMVTHRRPNRIKVARRIRDYSVGVADRIESKLQLTIDEVTIHANSVVRFGGCGGSNRIKVDEFVIRVCDELNLRRTNLRTNFDELATNLLRTCNFDSIWWVNFATNFSTNFSTNLRRTSTNFDELRRTSTNLL